MMLSTTNHQYKKLLGVVLYFPLCFCVLEGHRTGKATGGPRERSEHPEGAVFLPLILIWRPQNVIAIRKPAHLENSVESPQL